MGRKGKKPPNPNVVVGNNSTSLSEKLKTHKKLILAVVLVIIVALGAGAGWYLLKKNTNENKLSCPGDIIADAKPILSDSTTDLTSRSKLVDKILTTNNYKTEPNCLAILTAYYVNASDAESAKKYNDLLKKNYDENTGYNSPIAGYLLAPGAFDEQISFLEQQAQAVQNNGGQYGGAFGDKK